LFTFSPPKISTIKLKGDWPTKVPFTMELKDSYFTLKANSSSSSDKIEFLKIDDPHILCIVISNQDSYGNATYNLYMAVTMCCVKDAIEISLNLESTLTPFFGPQNISSKMQIKTQDTPTKDSIVFDIVSENPSQDIQPVPVEKILTTLVWAQARMKPWFNTYYVFDEKTYFYFFSKKIIKAQSFSCATTSITPSEVPPTSSDASLGDVDFKPVADKAAFYQELSKDTNTKRKTSFKTMRWIFFPILALVFCIILFMKSAAQPL
jgi:hypothetical protein